MFSASTAIKLAGSTVVIACPCVGNLGAMTVDCLLATVSWTGRLVREGSGVSKYLLPVTGYDSFPGDTEPFVVMPLEVYSVAGVEKLFIVQIRSDCHPKDSLNFSSELTNSLRAAGVVHALLVSGFGEDDVLDEFQSFSIGAFYARSTSAAVAAIQSNIFPMLAETLSSALLIEAAAIGVDVSESNVEMDVSNVALNMLKQSIQSQGEGLPISVVGTCCRLNHRFRYSKENAFRIGASLGILPDKLQSVKAPSSWNVVFAEEDIM